MDLSQCAEETDVTVHMGLGSFGAQSTTKKRKHSLTADAFPTDKAKLSEGISPLDGMRLHEDDVRDGHPRSSTALQAQGAQQSTLLVGRTQGELFSTGKPASANSSRRAMVVEEKILEKDYEEPSYVEDTPFASPSSKVAMPYSTNDSRSRNEERSLLEHPHQLPHMDKLKPTGSSPEEILLSTNKESTLRDQHHDWVALRRGVWVSRGEVAYYDKSFIEDPWQGLRSRLEKERRSP